MENSDKPQSGGARIIRLQTRGTRSQTLMMSGLALGSSALPTLGYLDQLLEDHFEKENQTKNA